MPFFYNYSPTYFWILLCIAFALLELTTPGLFACLAFSGGCLVSAASVFFTQDPTLQSGVGLIASVLIFYLLKKHLQHAKFSHATKVHPTSNMYALIGKEAHLEQDLEPDQTGYARVEREVWSCKNSDTITLPAHGVARIVNIQGNTILIKSKEQS